MWDRVFNPDNKLFTAIRKILDMVVIGITWLLCNVTVILAGPASAGLYYAMVKSVRCDRSYALREFWSGVRKNFKKGLLIQLILLALGWAIFALDIQSILFYMVDKEMPDTVFLIAFFLKYLLYFGINMWVYPLLSRFEGGSFRILYSAFLTMLRNIHKTFLGCLLGLLGVFVCLEMPILVLIVPGIVAFFMTYLVEPYLRRLCWEKQENGGQTEHADPWYLET